MSGSSARSGVEPEKRAVVCVCVVSCKSHRVMSRTDSKVHVRCISFLHSSVTVSVSQLQSGYVLDISVQSFAACIGGYGIEARAGD